MDPRPDRADSRKWAPQEDAVLVDIVTAHGAKNWKAIAALFCERSDTHRESVQCLQRWRKVLQPGLKKGKWSLEEDSTLMRLVKESIDKGVSPVRWPKIANKIPGRTSKQCRERWTCNLDPRIVRNAFTLEEDELILGFQARFGNRWALIAQNLHGRTENAIKARFGVLQKQRKLGGSPAATSPSLTSLPLPHQLFISPPRSQQHLFTGEDMFPSQVVFPSQVAYPTAAAAAAAPEESREEETNRYFTEDEEHEEKNQHFADTLLAELKPTTTTNNTLHLPTPVSELDRFFADKLV